MTMTNPDLRYILSIISQYCANSDSIHAATIIQILTYMRGTLHYSLTYSKDQSGFDGYIDEN